MTEVVGRHGRRGRHEAGHDPSFGGLFICSLCGDDWDTFHEELGGCPYLGEGPRPVRRADAR